MAKLANCDKCSGAKPFWQTDNWWLPSVLCGLAFAWAGATAVSTQAAYKSPPSCWVEFPAPDAWKKLAQSGVSIKSVQDFDRYAVLINPSIPDYRYGLTADNHAVFQFMASCENSMEAIDALVDEALRKKMAAHG